MKPGASGSKAAFAKAAPHAPADWIWGGLGVGAATVSSAFAVYMLTFGPPAPRPGARPDFGVFATMRPRSPSVESSNSSGSQRADGLARTDDAAGAIPPVAGSIDFAPTGSVQGQRAADPMPQAVSSGLPAAAVLPGFVLRDVFDGKALVESRNALSLVAPGSTIDGAGEVLAIEQRGDRWIVAMTRGIIGAPSR